MGTDDSCPRGALHAVRPEASEDLYVASVGIPLAQRKIQVNQQADCHLKAELIKRVFVCEAQSHLWRTSICQPTRLA